MPMNETIFFSAWGFINSCIAFFNILFAGFLLWKIKYLRNVVDRRVDTKRHLCMRISHEKILRGICLISFIYLICRVDLLDMQIYGNGYEYPTSIFFWHCINFGWNVVFYWLVTYVRGYVESLEKLRGIEMKKAPMGKGAC